jgi:putative transposase
VIEGNSDFIACRRDIALNPVRARMVPTAEEYPWSSDRCNALGLTAPVVAAYPL